MKFVGQKSKGPDLAENSLSCYVSMRPENVFHSTSRANEMYLMLCYSWLSSRYLFIGYRHPKALVKQGVLGNSPLGLAPGSLLGFRLWSCRELWYVPKCYVMVSWEFWSHRKSQWPLSSIVWVEGNDAQGCDRLLCVPGKLGGSPARVLENLDPAVKYIASRRSNLVFLFYTLQINFNLHKLN